MCGSFGFFQKVTIKRLLKTLALHKGFGDQNAGEGAVGEGSSEVSLFLTNLTENSLTLTVAVWDGQETQHCEGQLAIFNFLQIILRNLKPLTAH